MCAVNYLRCACVRMFAWSCLWFTKSRINRSMYFIWMCMWIVVEKTKVKMNWIHSLNTAHNTTHRTQPECSCFYFIFSSWFSTSFLAPTTNSLGISTVQHYFLQNSHTNLIHFGVFGAHCTILTSTFNIAPPPLFIHSQTERKCYQRPQTVCVCFG